MNRPTHAVMFTIHNTVGMGRQPYYCSSQRYGTISAVFSVTFDEINHLQQTGFVNVNGNPYPIELFLSLDMKVGVV